MLRVQHILPAGAHRPAPPRPAAGKGRCAIAAALRLCPESELQSADDVVALRDWAASAWDYLAMGEAGCSRALGALLRATAPPHPAAGWRPLAGWHRAAPPGPRKAAHPCRAPAASPAGNYPYPSSYIVNGAAPPLPAYPVRAACAHLADEGLAGGDPEALLQALGAAVGVFYK